MKSGDASAPRALSDRRDEALRAESGVMEGPHGLPKGPVLTIYRRLELEAIRDAARDYLDSVIEAEAKLVRETSSPQPKPRVLPERTSTSSLPTGVFICHASRDSDAVIELSRHMSVLSSQGLVRLFRADNVPPGAPVTATLFERLGKATLMVCLLSDAFFADATCTSLLSHAMESPHLTVVPVLLRASEWDQTCLADLQPLPEDRKPISERENRDAAWNAVVKGIRSLLRGAGTGAADG